MIRWVPTRRRRLIAARLQEIAWVLAAGLLLILIRAACAAFGVQAP